MAIMRLQRRGMLTVPRDIRQKLHLEEGQPLMVRIVDLETWESDALLSWTDAVLIQRAQSTALPILSRNHRDSTRYDLPPSSLAV